MSVLSGKDIQYHNVDTGIIHELGPMANQDAIWRR